MSGNLDNISRLLGNIEAKQDALDQKVSAVFTRMDIMRNEHSELLGVVKEHSLRVNMIEEELTQTVEPAVQTVNQLKQRGIGAIAVIGLAAGGAGAMIAKVAKVLPFTG